MSFYIRKAVKFGPIRFNLSKGGIGLSVGVPGFRIGTGPRGGYVHAGRGGIYYRTALGGKTSPVAHGPRLADPGARIPQALPAGITEEVIESADIWQMQDATASLVLDEVNRARKRFRLAIIPGVFVALGPCTLWGRAPTMWDFILLSIFALTFIAGIIWDQYRRTAVILYEIDADVEVHMSALDAILVSMQRSAAVKISERKTHGHDAKYNAGATTVLNLKASFLRQRSPPGIKTNVSVWGLGAGRQTLYFMPDALLIYDQGQYGAVSYRDLRCSLTSSQIIDGSPPCDAVIVGKTWQHPNKNGGPDKRFKDNPQIAIVKYEVVTLTSPSGLQEEAFFSASSCTKGLPKVLADIASLYEKTTSTQSKRPTKSRVAPVADEVAASQAALSFRQDDRQAPHHKDDVLSFDL